MTFSYLRVKLVLCGSRKYPYPHHRGNRKFLKRVWESKTQEISEGRGVGWSI